MIISFKKILSNNAPLKIFSLILGYMVWNVFSAGSIIQLEQDVPLSFFNIPDNIIIDAPETVHITLSGKRSCMHTLNITSLAIHLDAKKLTETNNNLIITNETLFLPNSIKVVHYTPAPLAVTITKK